MLGERLTDFFHVLSEITSGLFDSEAAFLLFVVSGVLAAILSKFLYERVRASLFKYAQQVIDDLDDEANRKRARRSRFVANALSTIFVGLMGSLLTNVVADATATTSRETLIVVGSLGLILLSTMITVYFAPSRMTVIAGISIGLIVAVFVVETCLWLNDYMSSRLEPDVTSMLVSPDHSLKTSISY